MRSEDIRGKNRRGWFHASCITESTKQKSHEVAAGMEETESRTLGRRVNSWLPLSFAVNARRHFSIQRRKPGPREGEERRIMGGTYLELVSKETPGLELELHVVA
jgi:hypothetical protein